MGLKICLGNHHVCVPACQLAKAKTLSTRQTGPSLQTLVQEEEESFQRSAYRLKIYHSFEHIIDSVPFLFRVSLIACSSGVTKYEKAQVISVKNRLSFPSDRLSEQLDELLDQ